MKHKTQEPNKVRVRRIRTDIREALLESALVEFGAKGFDGASTRAIASRVQAHQPQINYHFESKAALWTAAVDHLFGLLAKAFDGVLPAPPAMVDVTALAAGFAAGIRRFVRFAAEHPELNQIMMHEGTAASDRLAWMTETHVKPFFNGIRPAWQVLRDAGVAAPIDSEILYYVLIGAASLPYVNAPEVRLLTGRDPNSAAWIDAHADGLVSILLPGIDTTSDQLPTSDDSGHLAFRSTTKRISWLSRCMAAEDGPALHGGCPDHFRRRGMGDGGARLVAA